MSGMAGNGVFVIRSISFRTCVDPGGRLLVRLQREGDEAESDKRISCAAHGVERDACGAMQMLQFICGGCRGVDEAS